jgi:hypothetical protein
LSEPWGRLGKENLSFHSICVLFLQQLLLLAFLVVPSCVLTMPELLQLLMQRLELVTVPTANLLQANRE